MLTQERLKELLSYDKETGQFTWLSARGNKKNGSIAGCINGIGYFKIGVDGAVYLSHRLAFLYVNGKFPDNQVDHINGERTDNRYLNIRLVSGSENHRNRGLQKNNKSGRIGVLFRNKRNKWVAQVTLNGKCRHLGDFDNIEDASKARQEAEKKYGFHVNHGKRSAAL